MVFFLEIYKLQYCQSSASEDSAVFLWQYAS